MDERTVRGSLILPADQYGTGPAVRLLADPTVTEDVEWCPSTAAQVVVPLDDVAGIDARTSPRAVLTLRAESATGTVEGEWNLIVRRIDRDFLTGQATVRLESPDTLFVGTRHSVYTALVDDTLQTALEYVTNYLDPTGNMFPAVITDDVPARNTPIGDLAAVRPQWVPGSSGADYLAAVAALYDTRLYLSRAGVLRAGPHRLVEFEIPSGEVLAASEAHDGAEFANVVVVRNSDGGQVASREVATSSPRHFLNGAGRRVHVINAERAYSSQLDRALGRGWSQQVTTVARFDVWPGDRLTVTVPGAMTIPRRRVSRVDHSAAGTSTFTFEPPEV